MATLLRNWRQPWSLVTLALLLGSLALAHLVSPFAGWLLTPAVLLSGQYADYRAERSGGEDPRE